MSKRLFVVSMVLFGGVCALLFGVFYRDAKATAIARLNGEQRTHARQAARGIEDFFATWTSSLAALSRMTEIVDADAEGKRDMMLFCEAHKDQIRSITRMDERGVIVASYPFSRIEGSSIADQGHVREVLSTRKPVVSEVFTTVQGFKAIAVHVPVFRGPEFRGSIAAVIDFAGLARRYLDVIRVGETGYAWVVSRDGTLLYTPIPGAVGRSALQEFGTSPSVTEMVKRMLRGGEGAATYTADWVGDRSAGPVRTYAVWEPVRLGNTFWAVAVASTESELLAGLNSFRNRLAVVIGLVFFGGMMLSTLAAKAWLIVRQEDERTRAERTLRESEERFRTLFESNPDAIFLTDPETLEILDCNPVACAMNGYERGELVGCSINVVHPDRIAAALVADVEGRRSFVEELRRRGVVTVESVHRRKDGTTFPIESSMCLFNLAGRTVVMGIDRDITERKRMEEELREREAQLSSILNNVSDVVFAVAVEPGERFRFIWANRRFLEATGLPESAVAGALVRDVIPQPAHGLVFAKYREAIASGQPSHWEEASEYPSGRRVGHVTVVPVFDADGTCRQLVGMVHDITDTKRAEEAIRDLNTTLERRVAERTAELAVARDRAQEADRLKSAFLATMSHELRTPLNSIIGFTGILLKGLAGPLNEEQRKQLDMVNQSARHLLELINDVLDLSKIEAGQFRLEMAEFDLPAAIRRTLTAVAPLADRKGLTLETDVAPGIGTITSDRRRVEQILLNLLSNAVKFTAKGAVAVECEESGGAVVIRVCDTGIGIKQEDMRLLFRPFQQLDSGLARAYEGTGLGLSICKRILDMLGGDISVESEPGRGSVFTVRLPAGRGEPG